MVPLLLILGLLCAATTSATLPCPSDDVAGDRTEVALIAEIERLADNVAPATIEELAVFGTSAALDGLLASYERMFSVFMRREVLRAIALFATSDEGGRALAKLSEVATDSPRHELRDEAIDLMAASGEPGRVQLARLVDSTAPDAVRTKALAKHAERFVEADVTWYREIFEHVGAKTRKTETPPVSALRVVAFGVLTPHLHTNELVAATKDPEREVRVGVIEELLRRGDKRVGSMADKLFQDSRELPEDRLTGARLVLQVKGPRVARTMIADAVRGNAPEELADGIADLLVELADPGVDKILLRKLGKGSERQKLFYLRATRGIQDDRVDRAYRQLLGDASERVVRRTIEILGDRRDPAGLPPLAGILAEGDNPALQALALVAIAKIRDGQSVFFDELMAQAENSDVELRSAAMQRLATVASPRFEPVMIRALDDDDWSIRLMAAHGIERMASVNGVGAICARIAKEEGRMVHDLAATLWRMSGQPFGPNPHIWGAWWNDVGADFRVIDPDELTKKEAEADERELRRVTKSIFTEERSVFSEDPKVFFGMRLISSRVIFVLDISTSMEARIETELRENKTATRMDLARRELSRVIGGLGPRAEFNLIVFGSAAESWSELPRQATAENVAAALKFLDNLPLGFSTNLYAGLRLAFGDRDVDTIYLVTDGEPSSGRVVDPWAIRRAVAEWNGFRGVTIHCIAVGSEFPLLNWLAGDTGGSYAAFE